MFCALQHDVNLRLKPVPDENEAAFNGTAGIGMCNVQLSQRH